MGVIITILVGISLLITFPVFLYIWLFNGAISGQEPCRALSAEELEQLQLRYPRERFGPNAYLLKGALQYHQTAWRAGAQVGFYDYLTVNGVKVHACFLDAERRNACLQVGDQGRYWVARGRRKFYVIEANGLGLVEWNREGVAWHHCWTLAHNDETSQARGVRFLGQRMTTPEEDKALGNYQESYLSNRRSLGCMLFGFALLLGFLFGAGWQGAVAMWGVATLASGLLVVALYLLASGGRRSLGLQQVNRIEGITRLLPSGEGVKVGAERFYFPFQRMARQFEESNCSGSLCQVEVTLDRALLAIGDICLFEASWRAGKPIRDNAYWGWISALLAIFAGTLWVTQLRAYDISTLWGAEQPQVRDYTAVAQLLTDPPAPGDYIRIRAMVEPYLVSGGTYERGFFWRQDTDALLMPFDAFTRAHAAAMRPECQNAPDMRECMAQKMVNAYAAALSKAQDAQGVVLQLQGRGVAAIEMTGTSVSQQLDALAARGLRRPREIHGLVEAVSLTPEVRLRLQVDTTKAEPGKAVADAGTRFNAVIFLLALAGAVLAFGVYGYNRLFYTTRRV